MSARIERTRKGEFRLRIPAAEREALRSLPDQLRRLLTDEPDDPSLYRLFPTAYQDDPAREEEYRGLMRDELLQQHVAALRGWRRRSMPTGSAKSRPRPGCRR